jgi:hypothetical protein
MNCVDIWNGRKKKSCSNQKCYFFLTKKKEILLHNITDVLGCGLKKNPH